MKKVAIVGVEGSGKTVMLAGLGELYSHPDDEGYFLAPKNYLTASYVSEKIGRMRKGEWPTATAEDVLQGLDWTLKRRQGDRQRPKDVCEVSCLDFAGEVYRLAFGIRQGHVPDNLADEVQSLKNYIRNADDLIVLINLRDIIVQGAHEPRVQEAMWITNEILSYALNGTDGRKEPRAAIVLSQADSYEETIRACGGARGVLAKYLPHVANNYDWLDILTVSAVDKTTLDDTGDVVPAHDFTPIRLRIIMDWIRDGLELDMPHVAQQRRPPQTPPPEAVPLPRQPPRQPLRQASRSPQRSWGGPPSGIRQYFTFKGRRNRVQFWRFYGFLLLSGFGLGFFVSLIGDHEYLIGLYALAMIWPSLSNVVRRLHDFNRSGWWWLLCCIPTVGWFFGVIIGLIKGTDGDNAYGPEP